MVENGKLRIGNDDGIKCVFCRKIRSEPTQEKSPYLVASVTTKTIGLTVMCEQGYLVFQKICFYERMI
jgi:hypothetical protein